MTLASQVHRSTAVAIAFALIAPWGVLASASAQSAGAAGPASATPTHSGDDDLIEIVVTGTSIHGVGSVGSNVIDITQALIQDQGSVSTADVLRDLPQVTNLGADPSRSSPGAAQRAVANAVGGTGINLRGLGEEATLSLLDGSRVPQGGAEGRYFDPNSLPLIAVQRIEVVPDGASAIYGSDAVTGVVNIIPITRFDGANVQAREGWAQGMRQSVEDAIAGHAWDSGGFVIAYEHNQQTSLPAGDRPGLYPNLARYGSTSTSTFPANLGNNPGPPPYNFAPGSSQQFVDSTNSGVLDSANVAASAGAAPGRSGNWVGADALPHENRNSFYLHADQSINSELTTYLQGFYTQRDYVRHNPGATTVNLVVPGLAAGPNANVYNQTPAAVAANYDFLNSLGNGVSSGFERIWQGRFGATATLAHDWKINLVASYGQVDDYALASALNNQALGAAASCTNPTVGAFAFPQRTVTTCNNATTAFDVFSNLQPGTPGFGYPTTAAYQSVLKAIGGYTFIHPIADYTDATLKVDGSIFELPGGPVRAALGVDYQHIYRTSVNGGTVTGPSTDNLVQTQYPNIARAVDAAFTELYVPIVGEPNAVAGIKSLAFDVALRYDRYQDVIQSIDNPAAPLAGARPTYNTTNPKFGLNWVPVTGLKLHAAYSTSFRAPTQGDYAYGAPTLGIPFAVTPQVAAALNLAPTCATHPGSCDLIEIQGGTIGVKPEKSRTWSFGGDFAPPALPGFDLSMSWYRINYDNQIVVPATGPWESNPTYATALAKAGLLVANPALGSFGAYNPATIRGYLSYGNSDAANPVNQYAPYVGLPGYLFANGVLPTSLLINGLNSNAGELFTQGIDYAVRYQWDSPIGLWQFADSGTYVLTYRQALASGTPLVSYLNQINNPLRFQTRAQIGWSKQQLVANAFINYVNAYDNPGVGQISSYTTVDVAVSYTVRSDNYWLNGFKVGAVATNLLNRAPPATVNIANQMAYDPQEASAIERLVSIQVSKKF